MAIPRNTLRQVLLDNQKDIEKYENYISGGVTFSGGEPLIQSEFVFKLAKILKKKNIHVAIDTAGSVPLSKSKKAIDVADLILLDVKALNAQKHKEITGFDNENTLKTLKYCESLQKLVWIRYVIVPGLTDDENDAKNLATFLKEYKCVERVEIIPFHKMGEYKWKELGIEYKLEKTQIPTATKIQKIKQIFKSFGLFVK